MLVLKDFFGYRTTFRNERNGTKGAKGRGVWSEGCGVRSEGRGPLWGGRAEDVTAPRGRRSDPKRLQWSEVSGENVGGIQKTSAENEQHFFCSRGEKLKNESKNSLFSQFSPFKSIYSQLILNAAPNMTPMEMIMRQQMQFQREQSEQLLRLQKEQAEQQAEFQKRMLEFMKKAS